MLALKYSFECPNVSVIIKAIYVTHLNRDNVLFLGGLHNGELNLACYVFTHLDGAIDP